MAAGDITLKGDNPKSAGSYYTFVGECELDDTGAEFVLGSGVTILSVNLFGADGSESVRVVKNSSDGTEGSQTGSFWAYHTGTGVKTYDFTVNAV